MEHVRKITDELAIAGQITPEQLQQLAQEGYRAVLNLRSQTEFGFLESEQQQAEEAGLQYLNMPLSPEAITDENMAALLKQMNALSKPILVHCDTGLRAISIVLMHLTVRRGASLKQAFQQVEQLQLFGMVI